MSGTDSNSDEDESQQKQEGVELKKQQEKEERDKEYTALGVEMGLEEEEAKHLMLVADIMAKKLSLHVLMATGMQRAEEWGKKTPEEKEKEIVENGKQRWEKMTKEIHSY
jgi:hypothetical protein